MIFLLPFLPLVRFSSGLFFLILSYIFVIEFLLFVLVISRATIIYTILGLFLVLRKEADALLETPLFSAILP